MTHNFSTLLAGSANLQSTIQRLPEIFSVVLIVGSAYTLATITWELLPDNNNLPVVPIATNFNSSANKTNAVQAFRQLSNAHLFGTAKTKSTTSTKAPETKLSLVLKGVLATIPMTASSAIIARSKNGAEEIYGIGDKLPGNVTIKEIYPDHVIISRDGQLETLKLPKDKNANDLVNTFANAATSSQTIGRSLQNVRNQILKNPTTFADYALPIVVKENGKQIGYRFDLQKKGDVFKRAGLQSTDIITSVNGIALDTPQKSIRALRKMSTASQLNLIVKRNGADLNINLRLQ